MKVSDIANELLRLAADGVRLRRRVEELERAAMEEAAGSDALPAPWLPDMTVERKQLFEIFHVYDTSFRIRGSSQYGAAAWIAGLKEAILSSLTWTGTPGFYWASGTISASSWVYLEYDMGRWAQTTTLKVATSLPDGTATTRIVPLWYVPFASSKITRLGIVDMRPAKMLELLPVPETDHSWHFTQTSATGGVVTLGRVYVGLSGSITVTSFPAGGAITVTDGTTRFWVKVDRTYATAEWGSGATVPDDTETIEYWEVLEITCADGVITSAIERWTSDIPETLFS